MMAMAGLSFAQGLMKPSRPGRRSPLRSLGTITATVIVVLAIQSLVGPGRPLQPPAVLSPWVRQAEQDFRPFAGGINREMVERAANVFPAFKVIIRDNELYVRTAPPGELNYIMKGIAHDLSVGLPHAVFTLFIKVLCEHRLPDMELVLSVTDRARAFTKDGLAPVFSWSKTVAHYDILYPYWQDLRWPVENSSGWVPWASKHDKAFWRGASTGGVDPLGTYMELSPADQVLRVRLVRMCKAQPGLCDVQITKWVQLSDQDKLKQELGEQQPTPPSESAKFKYVIVVDGNSAPSSRMVQMLHGDSLLLWQQTMWAEPFYNGLRPFVHYVPVSSGLDDLFDKIRWAQTHQEEAKAIVRNAQEYARAYLTPAAAADHMHMILQRYAGLLTFVPNLTAEYKKVWLHWRAAEPYIQQNYTCPMWKNDAPDWVNKERREKGLIPWPAHG